ncbi:MAG TPA: FHA domain-containing protein [Chthoniobacterales bacterium]
MTGTSVLGRAAEADVVLPHPEISRRHCRILQVETRWYVEDLGSQRGTFLNDARIGGRMELHPGDRLTLGPVVLVFGQAAVPSEAAETVKGRMRVNGQLTNVIPLGKTIVLGRGEDVDVQLNDTAISRQHARIQKESQGYRIFDLHSKAGSFVNGRRFDEHALVIGDQVQIGPFCFVFDGRQLARIHRLASGRILARNLAKTGGSTLILKNVSFSATQGQFIGILGPSGAGKTTLLNALSGLRPADTGQVLVDGTDYYAHLDDLRAKFGYVPQDDIVHAELTLQQALSFAARLRLPAGTPRPEIRTLISHTVEQLGLSERAGVRIGQLSGGQRKRASVAAELLNRPSLLFLDEPTSGLDPLAEFRLMELLRRLADTGCTVICTTHVMENVYLMDEIAVLVEGQLIFQGAPDAARAHFNVSRLSGLYDALQSPDCTSLSPFEPPIPDETTTETRTFPKKERRAASLPILLERQAAIFRADPKNLWIVLGQPVLIGALVAWASQSAPLAQFFAYITTLWFGCSNSAQEIVRELPIYRRERLVGLGRWSYLLAKLVWMGGLTSLQVALLFLIITLVGPVGPGLWPLQLASLVLLAFAATGIGLTVSTLARSPLQAMMLVPMILIPQILFSGFTVPVGDMASTVLPVSKVFPSFAAERIVDCSFILGKPITGDLVRDFSTAYQNLNQWQRQSRRPRLMNGARFEDTTPVLLSFLNLSLWTAGGFLASSVLLARKERG